MQNLIDFKPLTINDKKVYDKYFFASDQRGCESDFANALFWGEHKIAFINEFMVSLVNYGGHYVYSYPFGNGDVKPVIKALIKDATARGIKFCLHGITLPIEQKLKQTFGDEFEIISNRRYDDYVYFIDDLAFLPGKKYHRKRNHITRFKKQFSDYVVKPITPDDMPKIKKMVAEWFVLKRQKSPETNFDMEQRAVGVAMDNYAQLELDGLMLLNGDQILAITMGSRLSADTFDVHFEKAVDVEGVYAVINNEFAKYVKQKYPQIQYLDREDDMGIEGLRTAKENYFPHHFIRRSRAVLKGKD